VDLEPQSLRGSQHRCNTVKLLADFLPNPPTQPLENRKLKKNTGSEKVGKLESVCYKSLCVKGIHGLCVFLPTIDKG
jgi:hypothetical protein